MKYPALITDRTKLAENIDIIQKICGDYPISFCAVTKCFCAAPEMTEVYYKAGVRDFADTRISNLKRINYPGVTKWLLRLPMLCEAEEVVENADISLNSEVKTVAELSSHATKLGIRHKIVLMVDVGDLREGVMPGDAADIAGEMLKYPGVELYGLGVNFNCYGGVIPNAENTAIVTGIAKEIEEKHGTRVKVISGGNSGSMHLLTSRAMPVGVTNLRLGEVVFFGRETSYQELVGGMHEDIFRLEAQIIELKKKPSMPIGEIGLNAFGEKVEFVDKGDMLRAIVACGRQDVDVSKIKPLDPKLEILGQSSDHMIIDVTHSDKGYEVGDVIGFSISYGALLSLSTSEYVHKVYE
jgi:predicted amino acid racemase